MTTIDIHAHLLPGGAAAVLRRGGGPWHGMQLGLGAAGAPAMATKGRLRALGTARYLDGLDDRLAWMDRVGIDVQVLSVPPPMMGYDLPAAAATSLAVDVNDELADIASSGRFRALATLPMSDIDAAVTELVRVMSLPGVIGVQLGTNVGGESWDAAGLLPVLAAAQDADAVVLLHPNDVRADASLGRYHLRNLIGNPFETTQAAGALVFGGVLERLPGLRVCLCHGGGYLGFAVGRWDHGWSVRPEARAHTQRPPSDYVRRFLVDALVHSDDALRHVVNAFGADRVVLGSDHPADMGADDPVRAVVGNPLLSSAERDAVLGANLARELGL